MGQGTRDGEKHMPHEKTFGHGPAVVHVGWDSEDGTYAQIGVVPRDGNVFKDGLFATLDEADLTSRSALSSSQIA